MNTHRHVNPHRTGATNAWRSWVPVAVLVVLALPLTGCGEGAGAGDSGGGRALPTSEWQPGDAGRQALLDATLRADEDGCLFVSNNDGTTRLPIVWPHGFSARQAANGLWEVLDPSGRIAAREGERFQAGGGLGPAGDRPCMLGARDAFFIESEVEIQPPTR